MSAEAPKMGRTGGGLSFRLFGFPITIRPLFFAVAVLFGMPDRWDARGIQEVGIWVALMGVGILVHELGHALMMRRFGYAPSIELHAMGGFARWDWSQRRPTPQQRFLVSIAGPAAGLSLGLIFFLLGRALPATDGSLWAYTLRQALWINIGWSILNMLPMLPWDGGKATEAFLEYFLKEKGSRVAGAITIVAAIGAGVLAIKADMIWGAMLAFFSVSAGWRALMPEKKPSPPPAATGAAAAAEASSLASSLATSLASSLGARARVLIAAGRHEEALALLEAERATATRSDYHQIDAALFYAGRYEEARDVALEAYSRFENPEDAYNLACCMVKLGRHPEAVSWLERAFVAGYARRDFMESDEDLAPLRTRPDYHALLQRMHLAEKAQARAQAVLQPLRGPGSRDDE